MKKIIDETMDKVRFHKTCVCVDNRQDRGQRLGRTEIERSSSKILYWLALFVENVGDLYYLMFL